MTRLDATALFAGKLIEPIISQGGHFSFHSSSFIYVNFNQKEISICG
jgi:hypothetical protein